MDYKSYLNIVIIPKGKSIWRLTRGNEEQGFVKKLQIRSMFLSII